MTTAAPVVPQAHYASARAGASELRQLHGLLVSHRGQLVFEYYAKGNEADRLANVKSASKSIIATLVGIAIERKLIAECARAIARWFPELRKDADHAQTGHHDRGSADDAVGTGVDERRELRAWVSSRNWVRYALDRPMVSDPGHIDGIQHGHVAHPVGDSHEGAARARTCSPTRCWRSRSGITLARWPRDPQGIYFGGNEMLDDAAADARLSASST